MTYSRVSFARNCRANATAYKSAFLDSAEKSVGTRMDDSFRTPALVLVLTVNGVRLTPTTRELVGRLLVVFIAIHPF